MRKHDKTPRPAVEPFDPIGSGQRILDDFMAAADRFDEKHGGSQASALRQLRKEGILTKGGNLTKHYRT